MISYISVGAQVAYLAVVPERPFYNFGAEKSLSYIKSTDLQILKFKNCERAGRVVF